MLHRSYTALARRDYLYEQNDLVNGRIKAV